MDLKMMHGNGNSKGLNGIPSTVQTNSTAQTPLLNDLIATTTVQQFPNYPGLNGIPSTVQTNSTAQTPLLNDLMPTTTVQQFPNYHAAASLSQQQSAHQFGTLSAPLQLALKYEQQ